MRHHRKPPILIASVLTWLTLASPGLAAPPAAGGQPANLLPNPSFENEADGKPAGWRTQTWGGKGTFAYADTGRTGKRSVMISSEQGADIGWFAIVPVEPHSTYRLSAWIKTEDVRAPSARGALLNLHNLQPVATKAVTGTADWTKVQVVFDTGGRDEVQVNCLFGGWGMATGKAWYDDIRLEKLSMEAWQPRITIDAGQTGEPISKYIYGQFIEHLGRCIYGGIWAEMLEDRKFYFSITAKYDPYRATRGVPKDAALPVVGASPWQIIGDADSVKMVKEDSFVGEQTPLIAQGGGIRQRDLGLVESKQYVGHIWLKPA
ncbi:MAG: carbohydrate binding domain-containing protein, partial [Planctomycetota bacterium]